MPLASSSKISKVLLSYSQSSAASLSFQEVNLALPEIVAALTVLVDGLVALDIISNKCFIERIFHYDST